MPAISPDLSPPIIYVDPETGEITRGGEDSPEADALRAELEEKRRARYAKMRGDEPPVDARPYNGQAYTVGAGDTSVESQSGANENV